MRKSKGSGTVVQRADGLWVASVDMPRKRGEKRRRKTFASKNRDVATSRLRTYLEVRPSTPPPPNTSPLSVDHTRRQWMALVKKVGGRCHYCGVQTIWNPQLKPQPANYRNKDHRIPLGRGGSNSIDNVVVACRRCNQEKATMTDVEYLEWWEGGRGN